MKKKIPEEFIGDDEVIAVIDPAEYWEWRTTIEEMHHEDTKAELATIKLKLMETEIRCASAQAALFKHSLQSVQAKRDLVKKNYMEQVKKLEEKYEITLKDCIIGDINYEVRKVTK